MPLPTPTRGTLLSLIGFICLVTAPAWVYLLLFPKGFDYGAGIVVFPVVLLLDFALLIHVSRNQPPELRKILTTALFFKLFAAAVYLTVMLYYYEGGDFLFYYYEGSNIAQSLINSGELGRITGVGGHEGIQNGTTFLHVLTGFLFTVTGPSLTAAILVFSSIAFWGVFLFWKAYSLAFPNSDKMRAAVLLFFLPSIVYWSATLGKDALLSFTIGLTAYGLATTLYRARFSGFFCMGLGVAGTCLIRLHIGTILVFSLALTYLLGRNRAGLTGMLAKLIGIPLVIFGTYYVFSAAQERFGIRDAEHAQKYAAGWSEVTAYGGSSFQGGSLAQRILMAPALPFRPFPWEVSSVQTLFASAEGTFLLALFWINRRGLKNSIFGWRSQPFVSFILFFSIETAVALSSAFSNFGLLARERVMFTPLLLMLTTAFPANQWASATAARSSVQIGHASSS